MSHSVSNPATPEIQEKLLKLWNEKNKTEFKKEIVELINKHEDFFKIMDLHNGNSEQHITREDFVKHFNFCLREDLSNALFSAIEGEKHTCSVVSVRLFFQGKRHTTVTKQKEIVKDAKWLWNVLKNLDLKDIDDNDNLRIEREELRNHFKNELDVALIDAIFDSIDADKNGHITPMEYFRWRHNSKLSSIQKIMHQAHKSLASPHEYSLEPIVEQLHDSAEHEQLLIQSGRDPHEGDEKIDAMISNMEKEVDQEQKKAEVSENPPATETTTLSINESIVNTSSETKEEVKAVQLEEPVKEISPEITVQTETQPVEITVSATYNEEVVKKEDVQDVTTDTETANIKTEDTKTENTTTIEEAKTVTDEPIKSEEPAKTEDVTTASEATEKIEKEPNNPQVENDIPKPQYYAIVTKTVPTEEGLQQETVKRTWVLSKKGNWRECQVIEEKEDAIKVHYVSYHPKYNEWIPKDSNRIQVNRESQMLQKGDNVSAWYPKVRLWTEAEIDEVDTVNNKIKIIYVGTKDVAYVPLNSSKISIIHKAPKEPFDGPQEEYTLIDTREEQNIDQPIATSDKTEPEKTPADNKNTESNDTKSTNDEDKVQQRMQQQGPATGCCQIL